MGYRCLEEPGLLQGSPHRVSPVLALLCVDKERSEDKLPALTRGRRVQGAPRPPGRPVSPEIAHAQQSSVGRWGDSDSFFPLPVGSEQRAEVAVRGQTHSREQALYVLCLNNQMVIQTSPSLWKALLVGKHLPAVRVGSVGRPLSHGGWETGWEGSTTQLVTGEACRAGAERGVCALQEREGREMKRQLL